MKPSAMLNMVMYHREFARLGGVLCGVYLTHLVRVSVSINSDDGWIPVPIVRVQYVTGLSPNEQMTCRIQLRGMGILEDKPGADVPTVRINEANLELALQGGAR